MFFNIQHKFSTVCPVGKTSLLKLTTFPQSLHRPPENEKAFFQACPHTFFNNSTDPTTTITFKFLFFLNF